MTDWTARFSKPAAVLELNRRFARAMMHCPALTDSGWNFRCVECHIAEGTYPSGRQTPWHSHEEWQIESILSGTFEFEAEGCKAVTMRPGQALAIPLRLPHRWKCVKRGVMMGAALEVIPTLEALRGEEALARKLHWMSCPSIRTRLSELFQSATAPLPFSTMTTACQMFLFLAGVMSKILPSSKDQPVAGAQPIAEIRGGELVALIIKRLNDNPAIPLTLDLMAGESGLSGRQIHRIFVKHTGKSLREWLLEQRMEMARSLIERQGHGALIKQIAFGCGFSSSNYFSTLYQKYFGCSPTAHAAGGGTMKPRITYKPESPGAKSKR